MRALLLVLALASCLPARSPSADYGKDLRACDAKQTDTEWVECCVAAARAHHRDPGFCFQ